MWGKKKFGPEKILMQKQIYGSQNNLGAKSFGQTNFW